MARFAVGVVFGVVVGVVAGAAGGLHAQDPQTDIESAAREAHVDPQDLQGALNSTGIADPYEYLHMVGALPAPTPLPPPPPAPAASARAQCIIRRESGGDPKAHRTDNGASGLGQFLPSTWLTTPQGKAGLSVYDPAANRAAIRYMLAAGRAREFDAVRIYGC